MTERNPGPVYTSTVVAWLPAAAAALISLGIAAAVLAATGSPLLIPLLIVAVVIAPVGAHLASVRLLISPEAVAFGHGLRGRLRRIPLADLTEWQAARLRRAQVYGVGLPRSRRLSRLTVRPGHALRLRTAAGEDVWLTTSDPAAACQVLDRYRTPAHETRPRRDPS